MGLVYSAEHNASSAAQVDFAELLAPSDAVIRILSVRIGQDSEAADAQAEMMGVKFIRATGSYTSGSGGGGAAAPHHKGAPAAGATAEVLNTTQAAAGLGTFTDLLQDAFNVQVGFLYQPTPDEYIHLSPSDALVIAATKAPADSVDWKVSITWEELGG
jgi:hypothetical protein